MRREGYEFAVSKPEVLYHYDERGKKLEPMEIAYVDVPEEFSGTVIQKLSERKGELQGMSTASDGSVRLEFHIPSRGLIGFRGEFLTSTKGTGILNTILQRLGIGPLPLIRTNGAVILGMVYNYLPYMILPLYSVIMKIDNRLIEAALDLGCRPSQVFSKVILPLSGPGILSGLTMVFVPAVSTFYISQKLGSTGTTLIGDVIESQFKTAYNPNLGAAMSLVLMILIFICVAVMNRFGEGDGEEVIKV